MPVTVSFPDVCCTKAPDMTTMETAVCDMKLVVYRITNGTYVVDSRYDFEDVLSGTVYVYPDRPADTYVFTAYANHSGLDLLNPEKDWTYFANERMGKFTMFGSETHTLNELITNPNVSIDLFRQVCKVSIKKISLDWHNEANFYKDFRVTALFLTDVPGTLQMMNDVSEQARDPWWNMNGHVSGSQDALLYNSVLDGLVTKESAYVGENILYGYVSSLQEFNNSPVWKAGGTRLVIEAKHGSETVYYPIPLTNCEEDKVFNKHFVFEEIIITRPGALQPYGIYPEENPVSFVCSVQEWTVINRGSIILS